MNPDKMTPEQIMEFCAAQNRTYKAEFTGAALDAFMADFNAFREEAAEEMLEATGLAAAKEVLDRIKLQELTLYLLSKK
jgi:hypothetical protein